LLLHEQVRAETTIDPDAFIDDRHRLLARDRVFELFQLVGQARLLGGFPQSWSQRAMDLDRCPDDRLRQLIERHGNPRTAVMPWSSLRVSALPAVDAERTAEDTEIAEMRGDRLGSASASFRLCAPLRPPRPLRCLRSVRRRQFNCRRGVAMVATSLSLSDLRGAAQVGSVPGPETDLKVSHQNS
jgi:hypothetical protein